MRNQILPLLLVAASITANAQQKKDSLYTRTIEDVKLHKTGNPNNARVSTIKSQLDVMETPQAIAIVTHEVIEQQQAQQLKHILRTTKNETKYFYFLKLNIYLLTFFFILSFLLHFI